jgi:hypothetical protein
MYPRTKYRCERVRPNNGIVEVFFTRTGGKQDELVIINVLAQRDQYQEGQFYWIQIEPAFPHS